MVQYLKENREVYPWNHMIWYKLEIPFLLKDVDKVLFLDADAIAIDNIKNIYQVDTKNYYSIVSQYKVKNLKELNPKLYKWIKEVIDNDGSDENPNCLPGVIMIFNLKKIREEIGLEKLEQKINECFAKYKDIIFTEEHIYMYILKDKLLYEDIGLDSATNNKVNFVSVYFSSSIGKPIIKDFNKDINEYFHKFWDYFIHTSSFKEDTKKYLDIYSYIINKQENKILFEKLNKIIDKIVWYIPIRKIRHNMRKKLQKYFNI